MALFCGVGRCLKDDQSLHSLTVSTDEMLIHKYFTMAQPRELSLMDLAFDNVKHLCYTGYQGEVSSAPINP